MILGWVRCITCIFDLRYFQPPVGLLACNPIVSPRKSVILVDSLTLTVNVISTYLSAPATNPGAVFGISLSVPLALHPKYMVTPSGHLYPYCHQPLQSTYHLSSKRSQCLPDPFPASTLAFLQFWIHTVATEDFKGYKSDWNEPLL